MITPAQWTEIRRLCSRSFLSSLHFAVATVDAEGGPHITPIGSLLLGGVGRAVFFDIYPRRLTRNVARDERVCILAVDSGKPFWLRGLALTRFGSPPAVRLYGRVVGPPRASTADERARWRRRVRWLRWLPGYHALWGRLERVRDVELDHFEPVDLGRLTAGLWPPVVPAAPVGRQ